jgi:hypothetical protein
MEVPHAFGLSSRRPGPGELILVLYGGSRWSVWRPPLLSEPGVSFVPRSIRFLGLLFFIPYAIKAPWPWGIAFWAFCARLICCGTARRLLHIYEGSLGRIGNTAPSSSDVIPMGSKRFALQGVEYLRVSLAQTRISTLPQRSPRPQKTYI